MVKSLKQIKNRIRSIENIKKVTNAMEMISRAKLNNIDRVFFPLRTYFAKMDSIMARFINSAGPAYSPLLEERADKRRIGLCLITSDSGLCGVYNNNIIRMADEFMRNQGTEKIRLVAIGRKGFNYFKRRDVPILNSYVGLNGRYSEKIADEIVSDLIDSFIAKDVDEVYIAYTTYDTALIRRPVFKKFLNIEPAEGQQTDYIFEPNKEKVSETIIPKYISLKFKIVLLEAFAAEHTSRAIAMKTATENAKELLDGLVLLRNKVRQANITQEILEVISTVEALKG